MVSIGFSLNVFGCKLMKILSHSFHLRYTIKHVSSSSYWQENYLKIFADVVVRECHSHSSPPNTPPWSVLFFGTDNFSVESLKALTKEFNTGNTIRRLEVVTSVKTKVNDVQKFAEKNKLPVHNWPPRIDHCEYDIGLVVSFGHLIPKNIISSFPLGMLNVHASLLPRWRGAAPIIYAIMNGDTETGVTIMQIKPHKFDTGGILKQEKYIIPADATLPVVSSALAELGSHILIDCIKELPNCLHEIKDQPSGDITYAPRVTPSTGEVKWQEMSAMQIYNLWRSLYDFFPLTSKWQGALIKLLKVELLGEIKTDEIFLNSVHPGYVFYQRRNKQLIVKCSDRNWISIKEVGIPAKKPMSPTQFYNGYVSKVKQENRYLE